MILEFPNYISNDFADYLSTECKKYITTQKQTAYNRDGYTVNISEDPKLKEIDSELHSIMVKINKEILAQRYRPQFKSADTGYEYHLYNPGDMCHYHSDGEVMEGLLRYASVVIHLTTNEDGGELIFPSQNKKIKTEKGKIVIFPPYGMFGHYVTPSSTAREVIVSWFIYDGVVVNKPF